MIRKMQEKDIDYLVDLGYLMHQESSFADLEYDKDKVRELGQEILHADNYCCYIYERENKIIGFIVGICGHYYFNHQKYASDYLLYIDPDKRGSIAAVRLLKELEKWAKLKNCQEIRLGSSANINPEQVKKLYERLGYTTTGHLFRKIVR
jgi:ribosomal protein S18 acetylase RimI-like enzyme